MKGKLPIYVKKPRSIMLWGLEYTQISMKMLNIRLSYGNKDSQFGIPLLLRIFSHPDFHCRSRTCTGSAAEQSSAGHGLQHVSCCHRRSGIAPCPEDRIDLVLLLYYNCFLRICNPYAHRSNGFKLSPPVRFVRNFTKRSISCWMTCRLTVSTGECI